MWTMPTVACRVVSQMQSAVSLRSWTASMFQLCSSKNHSRKCDGLPRKGGHTQPALRPHLRKTTDHTQHFFSGRDVHASQLVLRTCVPQEGKVIATLARWATSVRMHHASGPRASPAFREATCNLWLPPALRTTCLSIARTCPSTSASCCPFPMERALFKSCLSTSASLSCSSQPMQAIPKKPSDGSTDQF